MGLLISVSSMSSTVLRPSKVTNISPGSSVALANYSEASVVAKPLSIEPIV